MDHSIGKVAELAGITVRTLHHYDRIRLLSPTARSAAGYRQYTDADIRRLQRVLFYRELGFPLDTIAKVLAGDDDHAEQLRRQRALLDERIRRLHAMVGAIDAELEADRMNIELTPEQRLEVFGAWRPTQDVAERARRQWSGNEYWQQAEQRTAGRTPDEWKQAAEESDAWVAELVAALRAGVDAESVRAIELAEAHRQLLVRWYFDCGLPAHVALTENYVNDPEQLAFLVRPERQLPGMGEFIAAAARANASRRS